MTAHPPKLVVVQTRAHVLAAARYEGRSFSLLTAPGAAGYAGPLYLQALVALAPSIPAIIDCGDDPGVALRALAIGWRHLLFDGPARERIISAAQSLGATVFAPAALGPRLALAPDRPPEPALGRFLAVSRG